MEAECGGKLSAGGGVYSERYKEERISFLKNLNSDNPAQGTESMHPIVLTVGVFDYFHYGHLRLFKQIRDLFPDCKLKVAVQESEHVKKYKPDANLFYPTDVRCDLVRSLRIVDDVIVYNDVDDIVRHTDFDIFAVGEDQNHAGFERAINYCESQGKQIARMSRTPQISSTYIKGNLDIGGG